ncbi:MAG: methionyl-tRNA formyltransferase [Ignavibacteriae bacterium HGW-Ignavibacteriae-4]|nr:MAG: methionyl-tRNA formyltransferase [Ignavibacteriae bacterium HGW-Ignavibacteriae-4]
MSRPRIVFMGTPEFSVPTLKALHEHFEIPAVVTVPDKPKGRGQKMMPSPVKAAAEELGLRVLQPVSLKDEDFINELKEIDADIFCIVAFRILPTAVFTLPKIASFNVHTSLLPKFRGAAPINWAIIKGEKKSGVTSFILDENIDTGNIVGTREVAIGESMTAGELHDELMPLAAELAVETCKQLLSGEYQRLTQDDSLATPAPKIFREDCKIDFNLGAEDLKNFINGMSPIPGAWTELDGKKVKLLKSEISSEIHTKPKNYLIKNDNFLLQTSSGTVKVLVIQPEGKKVMQIRDFLAGYRGNKEGILE